MPNAHNFGSDNNISLVRVISEGGLRSRSSFKQDGHSFRSMQAKHSFLFLAVVTVCLGLTGCTKKVVVPDVTQQDLDQAKQALTTGQLKVGTVSGIPSGGSTAGAYVSSQNPAAGQQVPADSTVDLVAVPPVLVPDLTKSKVADAVNNLQGAGLQVALVKQSTANIFSGGNITQQAPAPNTPVRPGSVVTLTVEAPPDLGGLLGMLTKQPAYQKLDAQHRNVLDQFLNPQATANSTPSGTPPPRPAPPGPAPPKPAPPKPAPPKPAPPKPAPPKPTPPKPTPPKATPPGH
jgi:hypothetical protein